MIRKRTLTVTYELPESLWNVLEEKAKREGWPMAEVVAEYKLKQHPPHPPISPEEERLHQKLLSHFGKGNGNDPHSSNNERIDVGLAREYQGER
ncbi:MAG: hypothetical protein ACLP9L_01135 [Thermoguttaceae bacterium]